ncbi:MAG: ATP-binding protein [Clostridiales bacterium]|nr:ATP-binding protein [Clostridiales bacterium]
MHKKIFRSSMLVTLLVLLSSIVLIMGVLYEYFESQLIREMQKEAVYISTAIENEGVDYLNSIHDENERITLISSDGTVIADTMADAESLENHIDRDEVKEAIQNGSGTSSRYSDTLTEKIVYYAVKMENGNILRISARHYTIVIILFGLAQPIAVVVLITLLLSLWLCHRLSVKLVEPINTLDLEHPENNATYDELTPLLKKIANQRQTINRQLKDAMQMQEEFKLITENMNEGFLVIDKGMRILTYNSSAMKFLDISEIECESILSVNRTKEFRKMLECVLSGERYESETESDERCCRFIANPVFAEGQTIGAVIVILDVTESVNREKLRREFTSNVSHELKTPLTSISGFAEIMESGDTPNEMVIDFSKSIYDEAQRLISLVSDIMKISELDEKAVVYEKETVDLYALSLKIAERLRAEADKKNIKINVIGDAAEVIGVRKILDEMIYNLCDNAVKYNKDNGIVDIIVNSADSKVKLIVRDTGIGIPTAQQSRVFERFYRVDKARSKAIGGTGLGLAIVKHGAMYHNAEIELESKENVGTSVSIIFEA